MFKSSSNRKTLNGETKRNAYRKNNKAKDIDIILFKRDSLRRRNNIKQLKTITKILNVQHFSETQVIIVTLAV